MPPDMPRDARPRLAPCVRLHWDPVRVHHVLLLPERVLVLNATGAAILVRCDDTHTYAGIVDELGAIFGTMVEQEVAVFLRQMVHRRLVVLDVK